MYGVSGRKIHDNLCNRLTNLTLSAPRMVGQMNSVLEDYIKLGKIGEGTYGEVYKVRHIQSNVYYAMKKIRLESEDNGIPATALREISILKELQHRSIIRLCDVILTDERFCLIFEYMAMDLRKYMSNLDSKYMERSLIRSYMHQLLDAIKYLHCHRIIHRDLKPQNLLVDAEGLIKIADFGLARPFCVPFKVYTHEASLIVTLWYRAPEVLLGTQRYGCSVDIWSLGCIFVEMFKHRPLFHGDSEIDQLFQIFRILGTPTALDWPDVTTLPQFKPMFPKWSTNYQPLSNHMDNDADAIDLLMKMFVYEPSGRIVAKKALEHRYFSSPENGFDPTILRLPNKVAIAK
ncbi:unnamed protein product [Didymodactylos carnosus]|uniref:Protein kinase domain-containing protein n=1 Tax=Didymodactylos carnosus TaxID=1234261 RepID=A0A814VFL7_9BILA|nr:unnamed protein product [Didymodactylos carnosus]CAF3954352.1 unnamed protein product [Didymodactylos carnosus]